MTELAASTGRGISPAATLSQAKSDLKASRDTCAALTIAVNTQVTIAGARASSARTRAESARQLAVQAQAAAAKARADVAAAQGNRLDPASLAALAALAQRFEALAVRAATAAHLAEQVAAGEENEAVAFNEVASAAAAVSNAAAHAHTTISTHQDPHQQAVLATGNEGARKDYLVG